MKGQEKLFNMIYSGHCKEFLDENVAMKIFDKLGEGALSEVCAAIDNAYDEGYEDGYYDGYDEGYEDAEEEEHSEDRDQLRRVIQ